MSLSFKPHLLMLRVQTGQFYLSFVRLGEGESVGPPGLGLAAEESGMFEVLHWTVGHTYGTASCFCRHRI